MPVRRDRLKLAKPSCLFVSAVKNIELKTLPKLVWPAYAINILLATKMEYIETKGEVSSNNSKFVKTHEIANRMKNSSSRQLGRSVSVS